MYIISDSLSNHSLYLNQALLGMKDLYFSSSIHQLKTYFAENVVSLLTVLTKWNAAIHFCARRALLPLHVLCAIMNKAKASLMVEVTIAYKL